MNFLSIWLQRTFAHPELLWLGPVVGLAALLLIWGRWQARRDVQRLAREPALRGLVRLRRPARTWASLAFLAGLVAVWLGAAGPQWGQDSQERSKAGQDVMVVLDVSQSMLAEQPSRLERALRALENLSAQLQKVGGHRVGLVAFAARPYVVMPLTHDYDHFRFTLTQLREEPLRVEVRPHTSAVPASGTRLGAALSLACAAVDPGTPLHVLLLSDGDDPAGDREWLEGIAAARARKCAVHVVGIGDPRSGQSIVLPHGVMQYADEPVETRLQEEPLREIARTTEGVYVPARTSPVALGPLVVEILRSAPSAATEHIPGLPRSMQRFAWLLGPALVLLMIALLVPTHPRRPALELASWRFWRRAASIVTAVAALFLLGAEALDLVRQGNAALARGDLDEALRWYERAEPTTSDPGLVAYNKGVAYLGLEKYVDAEEHFHRCLEDEQAPTQRRARARFGLGNALLLQAQGKAAVLLERAIAAYEDCLVDAVTDATVSAQLAADARFNLELAKLLRLQAGPPPEPQPKAPGDDGGAGKNPETKPGGLEKNGKKVSGGEPSTGKDAGGGDEKTRGEQAAAGLLKLLEQPDAVPLTADDTALLLEQIAERLRRERRQHLEQTAPKIPNLKDW